MAVTGFQAEILRRIARLRIDGGETYVAGGLSVFPADRRRAAGADVASVRPGDEQAAGLGGQDGPARLDRHDHLFRGHPAAGFAGVGGERKGSWADAELHPRHVHADEILAASWLVKDSKGRPDLHEALKVIDD